MKSIVRAFAHSAAAASKRPLVATVPTANRRTFRFNKAHLLLALGLMAPLQSFASSEAPYCIAVGGGFGIGSGATFVSRNYSLPGEGKCTPWTGYTQNASTVILMTSGGSRLFSRWKTV